MTRTEVGAVSVMTAIAAHRGGAELWPENSRVAFTNSAGMGVDFIEFDVHRTSDGHLVVHHDAQLGRTAEGSGEIATLAWEQVRRVPLRDTDGECIPDLVEVLDLLAAAPAHLRLEIKQPRPGELYDGIEGEIVERLAEMNLLRRTTFTSFDPRYLDVLRNRMGHQALILLVRSEQHEFGGRNVAQACRTAQAVRVPEIAIRVNQIQPGDRQICQEHGIRLGAFAVNQQSDIDWALAAGMCAFTTDRPDLALTARAKLTMAPDPAAQGASRRP